MEHTLSTNEQSSVRPGSPLFPYPVDEKQRYLYADEIGRIDVYWQPPEGSRRVRLPPEAFLIRGTNEVFAINPFSTTEADLQAQIGGGDFYIEPYAVGTFRVMPGGRKLPFGGRKRLIPPWENRGIGADTGSVGSIEDDDDPLGRQDARARAETASAAPQPVFGLHLRNTTEASLVDLLKSTLAGGGKNSDVLEQLVSAITRKQESRDESMVALREQLAAKDAAHAKALADLTDSQKKVVDEWERRHRTEVERITTQAEERCKTARKEADDARDEYNQKRRANELETLEDKAERRRESDRERTRLEKQIDELKTEHREAMERLRREHEKELADAKSRFDRDLPDATRRAERGYRETLDDLDRVRKDFSETERRLNKQLLDAQREVLDLSRRIAETPPDGGGEPPPPVADGAASATEPFWFARAADAVQPFIKAAGNAANALAQNAARQAGVPVNGAPQPGQLNGGAPTPPAYGQPQAPYAPPQQPQQQPQPQRAPVPFPAPPPAPSAESAAQAAEAVSGAVAAGDGAGEAAPPADAWDEE